MKEKKSNFKGKIVSSYRRQKESRGSFGYLNLPKGVEMFKIPEETRSFSMDFLPYVVTSEKHIDRNNEDKLALPGSLWYRTAIKVHRNVGANNETVICPTTIGKKCPICEFRVKRIKEGADKEEFKLLYPQDRSLYPVIPISRDSDEKVMVWDMSDYLFQETLMDELLERDDCEDFFTLENGKTVSLRLKWKEIGKSTFPEVVSIDFKDRDPYDEKVLDDVPSLDEILKILSYEEISAKFYDEEVTDEKLDDVNPEEEELSKRVKSYQRQSKEEEPEKETPKTFRRSTRTTERAKEEEADETPESEPLRRRKPVEEEQAPPKQTRTREPKETPKGECPYGHVFGVDTDEFKDCNSCEIWDDCDEEKERNSKKK